MIAKRSLLTLSLFLPMVLFVVVFSLFPILRVIVSSLFFIDSRFPDMGIIFVGFRNYIELFSDPRVLAAVVRSLVFCTISVSLEIIFGLLFALLLDEIRISRRILNSVLLIPWVVPTIVAGFIWVTLFDDRAGIIRLFDLYAGGRFFGGDWFVIPIRAWVVILLADVWKTIPFVVLLLYAALQRVDRSLIEAAVIDGASLSRMLWYVKVPIISPTIIIVTLFRGIDALRLFELVYVVTKGGPGTATEPLTLFVFNAFFDQLRIGYGSAAAVILFLVTMLFAGFGFVIYRMVRR